MNKESNVAIYVRVENNDEIALKNQTEYIKEYLEKLNIKVGKIYSDIDVSDKTFNRPALNNLIKDVEDKKIKDIYISDLSRLSEDRKNVIEFYKNNLGKNKVNLFLVKDRLEFKQIITISDLVDLWVKEERKKSREFAQKYRNER